MRIIKSDILKWAWIAITVSKKCSLIPSSFNQVRNKIEYGFI